MTDVTEKTRPNRETGVGPYSHNEMKTLIQQGFESGVSERNLDDIFADAKQRVRDQLTRDAR